MRTAMIRIRCPCCDSIFEQDLMVDVVKGIDREIVLDKSRKSNKED